MTRPRLSAVKPGDAPTEQPEIVSLLESMLFDARSGLLTDIAAVAVLNGEFVRYECHDLGQMAVVGAYTWAAHEALIEDQDED